MERRSRGILSGCLPVLLVMAACASIAFLAMERQCRMSMADNLPLYPGAEVVFERHSFVSSFGVGLTLMELYSPDPPSQVSAWYGRAIGMAARDYAQGKGGAPWRGKWTVTTAEDGKGSLIILTGSCP